MALVPISMAPPTRLSPPDCCRLPRVAHILALGRRIARLGNRFCGCPFPRAVQIEDAAGLRLATNDGVKIEVETSLLWAVRGSVADSRAGDGQHRLVVDLRHEVLRTQRQCGVQAALPEHHVGVDLSVMDATGRVEKSGVDVCCRRCGPCQRLIDAGMRLPKSGRRRTIATGRVEFGDSLPSPEYPAVVLTSARFPDPLRCAPFAHFAARNKPLEPHQTPPTACSRGPSSGIPRAGSQGLGARER